MNENVVSFTEYKKKKQDYSGSINMQWEQTDVNELIYTIFSHEGRMNSYVDYLNSIRDIDEAIFRLNRFLSFLDEESQEIMYEPGA